MAQALDVRKGAEASAVSVDGRTPLMSAAQAGHLDVVKILVGSRTDIHIKSDKGYTAAMYARQWNQMPVLEFLKENTT